MAIETQPWHYLVAAAFGIPGLAILAVTAIDPLRFLFSLRKHLDQSRTTLPFSPSRVSHSDIVIIYLFILLKYIKSAIGLIPKLPSTSLTAKSPPVRADAPGGRTNVKIALPLIEITCPLESGPYDAMRLARAIWPLLGKQDPDAEREEADSTSPMLLVALTTPLMLLLLAHQNNPILPLGAVHVANRYEFVDPVACRNADRIDGQFVASAKMGGEGGEGRRTRKGVEFDITVEVVTDLKGSAGGSKPIFRQVVTVLSFLKKSQQPRYIEPAGSEARREVEKKGPKFEQRNALAEIKAIKQAPRRWATVSGDYNPIHLSKWAAKAFGFKNAIIHGNHMVALAVGQLKISELSSVSKEAKGQLWNQKQGSWLEVEFKRPILVSSKVAVRYGKQDVNESNGAFEIVGDDEVKVLGRIGSL